MTKAAAETGAAIEVTSLCKNFGAFTAVKDVSFEVRTGEVLGFLGPNGAGKSTTMKMITGFLTPTQGQIRVAGFDVSRQPIEVKRRIGYLPEGAPAYDDMTATAFLDFIARIRGYNRRERRERVAASIDKANLGSVVHKPIETLSKGFKRRVGLAQAILHDPPILVMDEPTDGLDPNQKHEVRELIREMARDKAILISTHILEEVDAICDRAIIIAHGTLLFDDTPQQLLAMSTMHNAVKIRFEGEVPAAAEACLRRLDEVADVIFGVGAGHLTVLPDGGVSVVRQVTHLAREEGWRIEEIFVESGQLDEVFRRITTRAEPVPGDMEP
ncbi:MAG: ABC transporter ATP-binding protein [Gammaproteobacteria bacterium]|nr:MAG: ABC transporter ATP-binding protein [Gammaproteobacteria bacterium]